MSERESMNQHVLIRHSKRHVAKTLQGRRNLGRVSETFSNREQEAASLEETLRVIGEQEGFSEYSYSFLDDKPTKGFSEYSYSFLGRE